MDNLLDQVWPYATFHDAELYELCVNYKNKTLSAEFELCVGNPNGETATERDKYQKGILKISGLMLWAIEEPRTDNKETSGPLWLTDNGLIQECSTETAKELAATITPETYGWYMYFSNLNAFAYLVAEEAVFEWKSA